MAEMNTAVPNLTQRSKAIPTTAVNERPVPELAQEERVAPDTTVRMRELPKIGNPENTVKIGDRLVEIKPMKLKYQRNRTAVFYHILELYPISDILAMENPFGDGRDGDKALCDWLVAATDDEELIRENLNEIDSETIYRILAIFRRINKIDELEEKQKNVKTPEPKKG